MNTSVVKHDMYIVNWFNMYFNGLKDLFESLYSMSNVLGYFISCCLQPLKAIKHNLQVLNYFFW